MKKLIEDYIDYESPEELPVYEEEDEGNADREDNDVHADQEAMRMTVMMEMLVMNISEGTSTFSLFCLWGSKQMSIISSDQRKQKVNQEW